MASLKEIAAQVGISYTVVSKVLSGRLGNTRVSEATRQAILMKARELNYTPNRLAVALKAGRKGAIGVFIHHFGNEGSDVVDRLLRGISEGLEKSGLRMWLRFFNTDEGFLDACDARLKSEVDGLIVAGPYHPGVISRLRTLISEDIPVVMTTDNPPEVTSRLLSNVCVAYESQGYLGVQHLLAQGCRRIACLDTHTARTAGYHRAHREAGVAADPKLIIPLKNFYMQSGETAVKTLIRSGLNFDGLACQSDSQAFGAINELLRRGIKVPEEVKITGIDDSPLASMYPIPLTSATSQMHEAGFCAVENLMKKINGETVEPLALEAKLVVRKSSERKI